VATDRTLTGIKQIDQTIGGLRPGGQRVITARIPRDGHGRVTMSNRAMARELATGKSVDIVEALGATPIDGAPGEYLLRDAPPDDVDLCVAATEQWIWSVDVEAVTPECGFRVGAGRHCDGAGCHGRIVASTRSSRYGQAGWTCVWAR
jgi:hypothetical protein